MPEIVKNVWSELQVHESEIFGYIKSAVGNYDLARDLCQDVYLSALQNIEQLEPDKPLRNWLITVARNRVINYFRERKRRQFEELDENLLFADPGHVATDNTVLEALNGLPERQRQVFILREMEGLSYQELSRELGISVSAITSLLTRARDNFGRNYLLNHLPAWFSKKSAELELTDLLRFINAFESPENLLDRLQQRGQQYFGMIREDWNDLRTRFFPQQILEDIFSRLGKQEGKQSVDLGCGPGFISRSLALRGSRVLAVDLNRQMLKTVKTLRIKFQLDKVFPLCTDSRYLSIRKQTIDQVFLALTLHHIPDPESQLKEAAQVLRREGKLIVVEFSRHNHKDLADQMRDLWLGFNPDTLTRWCKNFNLDQIGQRSWNSKTGINVFYQIFKKN